MQPLLAVIIGTALLLCANERRNNQQLLPVNAKKQPVLPARHLHDSTPGTHKLLPAPGSHTKQP